MTFTATVTAVSPGSGTPTGNVKFMDGTKLMGTVALDATGHATFATTTLSVASHGITAVYADDVNYAPSTSAAITETVKKASTTTSLSSSANPSTSGQSVTFTATVSPVAPSVGIPTGSVKFMSGSTLLATVALNAAGTATYTTSTLSVGSHSITAVYVASTNFAASTSAAVVQIVNAQTANNDNFANAAVISGTSITLNGTNVGDHQNRPVNPTTPETPAALPSGTPGPHPNPGPSPSTPTAAASIRFWPSTPATVSPP